MIHIYIYAENRLWDTDRISRLRRPPLKRRAITHFGEKHLRLGAGWVVGKPEVIARIGVSQNNLRFARKFEVEFDLKRASRTGRP